MNEKIYRIVVAYKRSLIRKVKKRSPMERLRSRQYYRTHKAVLRIKRKRYHKTTNVFSKSRKLFKRTQPKWLSKKKFHNPKPKFFKPKKPTVKKFHVPKRIPRKK